MIIIFKCLDDLKLTRWAINVMPTLPFYAFGNVAILGDAVSLSCGVSDLNIIKNKTQAHAMTPFQGAGAGQAIEVSLRMMIPIQPRLMMQDASILAALFSNELTTKTTVRQVLDIYSQVRQPLATEVARRSRVNVDYVQLRSLAEPDHHDLSSSVRFGRVVEQIQDNFEWVYQTDCGTDLQQAMSLLQAELAT